MKPHVFSFSLITSAIFTVSAVSAKDCDAILAAGLSDTYSFSDNSSFENALHSSICSNRSTRRTSSGSIGLNIPLPDVAGMLGFSTSDQSSFNRIDDYCRSAGNKIDHQAAVNWTKKVVNPVVVQAWENCEAERGFQCETSNLSGNEFSLTISWSRTNVGSGTEVAILETAPNFSNAVCGAAELISGFQILDDSSYSTVCSFKNISENAYVVMNSSQGPATCVAPAKKSRPTAQQHLENCLQGSETSCLGIIQDAGHAYSKCQGLLGGTRDERFCANLATGFRATEATADHMIKNCFSAAVNHQECQQAKTILRRSASTTIAEIEDILNR